MADVRQGGILDGIDKDVRSYLGAREHATNFLPDYPEQYLELTTDKRMLAARDVLRRLPTKPGFYSASGIQEKYKPSISGNLRLDNGIVITIILEHEAGEPYGLATERIIVNATASHEKDVEDASAVKYFGAIGSVAFPERAPGRTGEDEQVLFYFGGRREALEEGENDRDDLIRFVDAAVIDTIVRRNAAIRHGLGSLSTAKTVEFTIN
jgi:hypothetical protein